MSDAMSDSDLREALIGTWRLIRNQTLGDNPQGYLVYTPDGHVFVQMFARERPELFGVSARGPVLLETTEAGTGLGFLGYCGTFEVRDGQAIHHIERHLRPSLDGREETRSVVMDGERLILGTPSGVQIAWQRVNPEEEPR
jgi:hypothetical protein